MKIALFGGSGKIGQRILLEALVRGHEVRALARHPEDFPIAHPRLTVSQVDIFDPASIASAIVDADVVVNATGAGLRSDEEVWQFFVDSTNAVIAGVRRAGDKRLIVVGGAGSLEVAPGVELVDTPDFPAVARGIARAQRETLKLYRTSAINWTFFSPSALIAPGKRTGKYRVGTEQLLTHDQHGSYISMEDYAVALLDEIEHPQFQRQRFTALSLEK